MGQAEPEKEWSALERYDVTWNYPVLVGSATPTTRNLCTLDRNPARRPVRKGGIRHGANGRDSNRTTRSDSLCVCRSWQRQCACGPQWRSRLRQIPALFHVEASRILDAAHLWLRSRSEPTSHLTLHTSPEPLHCFVKKPMTSAAAPLIVPDGHIRYTAMIQVGLRFDMEDLESQEFATFAREEVEKSNVVSSLRRLIPAPG